MVTARSHGLKTTCSTWIVLFRSEPTSERSLFFSGGKSRTLNERPSNAIGRILQTLGRSCQTDRTVSRSISRYVLRPRPRQQNQSGTQPNGFRRETDVEVAKLKP